MGNSHKKVPKTKQKISATDNERNTYRNQAINLAKKHKKLMKGKKIILVPHPIHPRAWIEKIVE